MTDVSTDSREREGGRVKQGQRKKERETERERERERGKRLQEKIKPFKPCSASNELFVSPNETQRTWDVQNTPKKYP